MSNEAVAIPDIPFARLLGIEVIAAGKNEVRGRLAWTPERSTSTGVIHGGALMALGDTLGAICAFFNLPPGTATATVESHTNFFRGIREGGAEGISRPLHIGRSFIVVQTELADTSGRLAAQVTQTQAVIPASPLAGSTPPSHPPLG
jgi:1,4-dihydroxy-2-naphthoyl-CoA hydrolase